MNYLVFPFGKYKGVKLKDLPSTYIVLVLEKYELPEELVKELRYILLGRFNVFSNSSKNINEMGVDIFMDILSDCITKYENL